jgi:hypothetical protein
LVNRHGLLALFPLFFVNIAVVVSSTFLWYINKWVAVGFAWLYLYYLLVQTRIIALLVVVGLVGGLIISGFTSDVSQGQVLYAIGLLAGASIVAHLVAYTITYTTGI